MNTADLLSLLAAPVVSRANFFSRLLPAAGSPPANQPPFEDVAADEATEPLLPALSPPPPPEAGFPA